MRTRNLILMLIKASEGVIEGKTLLQKEMYFLSLLLKRDLGFQAHYYGPYSNEVEDGLDELIGAGFVDVSEIVWGINQAGFEAKKYSFKISDLGKKLVGSWEESDEYSKIKNLVERLRKIEGLDYIKLSLAAKSYFVLNKENKPMSIQEIKNKSKNFGWDLKEDDIDKAVEVLERLEFVEMKKQ